MSYRAAYFPSELPVDYQEKTYFKPQNLLLCPFSKATLSDCDYFFLLPEVKIEEYEKFINIASVWQKFLKANYPHIKVVRIGMIPTDVEKGTLHWLSPPIEIARFLQNVPYHFAIEEHGQTAQPVSISDVWVRFWDGHNRGGFRFWLIDLRGNIAILSYWLRDANEKPEFWRKIWEICEDITILAKQMSEIWQSYFPYWKVTPFLHSFEKIQRWLSWVDDDISLPKNLQKVPQIQKNLELVLQLLTTLSPFFEAGHENK